MEKSVVQIAEITRKTTKIHTKTRKTSRTDRKTRQKIQNLQHLKGYKSIFQTETEEISFASFSMPREARSHLQEPDSGARSQIREQGTESRLPTTKVKSLAPMPMQINRFMTGKTGHTGCYHIEVKLRN